PDVAGRRADRDPIEVAVDAEAGGALRVPCGAVEGDHRVRGGAGDAGECAAEEEVISVGEPALGRDAPHRVRALVAAAALLEPGREHALAAVVERVPAAV